ncbi:proteasome complex subunit Rpn13 ubiquitin receptor-domain-containing protein [Fomitopsis serialis]|uniref:proteasome complex subunit Rpn13 ubiquitin receptor-domain-containing protein n=1 Tax=Fomitopsis serialis TaxID=139415 RepID=UPI002007B49E|nr:proteasome complex subunit Rpn13 ubiquitin receptor-domain-containing protein [Neoantrodia serialis]KAH9936353.1 proteasome complex subunit Rpn13 ubiquitin receptor-domain-containing protein [Neoantrodia serialis]
MADPRIAFKAGRCFRRENTNFVDVEPTKGAIILQNGEDGLLHFMWKDRSTNDIEEDLILFPGEATLVKVDQSAWGRTYVLKFSSSNQRHFSQLNTAQCHDLTSEQDADSSRDAEFVSNVNRLLTDPQMVPIWSAPGASSEPQASTSSAPAAGSSQAASTSQATSGAQATPEQLAQMQQILASFAAQGAQQQQPGSTLPCRHPDPANLTPLFSSHPELVQALFPYLPPDLPTPPNEETLRQIIASPQFRGAVRSFDQALRTGLLGGLVRGLGLPEEAGTGVEAFLNAIQEQARQEDGGDRMDTD